MAYFTSKDIMAISIGAALWAILNVLISPIFWQLTHMPFLCDFFAFVSLVLIIWLTRKLGAASLNGFIATVLTLVLRPAAFHMLGFIVASIVFDALTRAIGYENCFRKPFRGSFIVIVISTFCAFMAGAIISSLFMAFKALTAILTFAGLHAIGGLIGGSLGIILVRALVIRNVHSIVNNINS